MLVDLVEIKLVSLLLDPRIPVGLISVSIAHVQSVIASLDAGVDDDLVRVWLGVRSWRY